MKYLTLLGLTLLLAGCTTTTTVVNTSDDFYVGCMSGLITDARLQGIDGPYPAKQFSVICIITEDRYKAAVRQENEEQSQEQESKAVRPNNHRI